VRVWIGGIAFQFNISETIIIQIQLVFVMAMDDAMNSIKIGDKGVIRS
jgi:hypothetical protein